MTTETALVHRGRRAVQAAGALFALGLAAGLVAFVRGHHAMGTTSEVPWGLLIATYVFLAVSSTGVSLVAGLADLDEFAHLKPLYTRAALLAWVLLTLAFFVIATELERPLLLMKLVLLSPNPRAPIWWMGTLYGFYYSLLTAQLFLLLFKKDERLAHRLAGPKLLFGVAASSNLGAVFALDHARPWWHGPFVPVYLIITGLVAGAGLLLLLVYFSELLTEGGLSERGRRQLSSLGRLLLVFLFAQALATAWRMIAGLAGESTGLVEVVRAQLSGTLFFSFWLFEVLLGMAVPALILLSPRRGEPKLLALAGSLPVLSLLIVRVNFVQAGQMLSLKPLLGHLGERIVYAPPFKGSAAGLLPYTPSITEVLIALGALAGVLFLFVTLLRALRLTKEA
jgi:Ni/Fe-hydrogenase subunit HybB-like protein